jgi:FlaA1/EpsC-like NDP-sugar epimerase
MKRNILILRRITPRWIVLTVDVIVCLVSLHLAYLVRFNFSIPQIEIDLYLKYVLPLVIFVRLISFLFVKSYAGIVRYTGLEDTIRLFKTIFLGSLLFVFINIFTYLLKGIFIIPFSIIIIEFLLTLFFLVFLRLLVKMYYLETIHSKSIRTNVAIIGKDHQAISLKRSLDNDVTVNYRVLAFFDSTNFVKGLRLEGIPIFPLHNFENVVKKLNIEIIIIADEKLSKIRKKDISEQAINLNLKVFEVPPLKTWINNELTVKQLRQIRIEDLLEREVIQLDKDNIRNQISNKVIFVTGAAGSIGREIVIQLTDFKPKNIILFDQAESPLYELALELEEKFNFKQFHYIVGDITNQKYIEHIVKTYQPSIIYHAAAYKHVPVMELNCAEAVFTNVKGTKIIADLAHKYNVERFVMISTDKAVNPANVMGATKRIAEMYCQSLGSMSNTKFITTRFGNVLGSVGSVVPRFRKQIEEGGPITVTHPEVTRYFMTIPEACQLVLEASAMGKGNEIFIFDMGKPVKIIDLAKKMIRLSGFVENKDIKIQITGLRPGEKLHEELLNNKESTLPTYHPMILIAKVAEVDYNHISNSINKLIEVAETFDNKLIISTIKEILPEYNNSNFA